MKLRFKKIATLVLTALGASALAAGISGCVIKSVAVEEPDNIEITKLAPPDDGSLPTAHSCAENLAYINYVFDHQKQYHSYSNGVTIASIATQTTRTFRDYKDGVLVTTDLTYSSMIKNSTQTCTILDGEGGKSEVYFRVGDTPSSNGVYPTELGWEQEAPKFFSEYTYHYTYGLLPTELFNYIINEDTLISSGEVVVNGNGTYSQSFVLDPVASTYYYQYGMKTRGGLAAYPTFQSIKFTVNFDKSWQILSSKMNEVAMVNKGILVESKSEFTCDYFYGGDHFDQEHYDYYEKYYKQYVGDETLVGGDEEDENSPLDVASVLSNGFSKIMNGGEQFEISAKLGSNTYSGYVWLTLDLEDIASSLALKVSLGKDLKNQTLYAEYAAGELSVYYGNDFGVNANIAAVKLEAQRFEQLINQIVEAITGKNSASGARAYAAQEEEAEEGDPLTALMGCMKLEEDDDTAVLSLVTDDLLGLGIGINAKLVFGVNGKSVLFRNAEIGGISIGGQTIDLSLGLQTTTAPVIDREALGTEADIADYVADVYSLLSSDLLKVELKLDGTDESVNVSALKNVSAEVTAYMNICDVTVGAEARVSYIYNGTPVSATVKIIYDYTPGSGDYGNAVLVLSELNGAPADVKLYCNVSELVSALGNLITLGGGQTSLQTDKLIGLLNNALSVDFSNLLTNMYADKAQIKIGVSVDTLLDMLGVDAGVKFGSCTLCYSRGEGANGGNLTASLPAIGFNLSVSGEDGEIEKVDKTDCLDLTYVLDDVIALANADLFKVNLSLDGSAEGVTLNQIKDLNADLTAYLSLNGIAVSADAAVSYNYNGNKISAKISVWYDNQTNKLALYLSEVMGAEVGVKLYCNVDELVNGIGEILDFAGVSLGGDESGIKLELSSVLSDLLSADFETLLPVLKTNANGLNISANADEIIKIFGADLGISFGNVDLAYLHGEEPKLFASAPALGLNIEICGADGEISVPDTDEYLDLAYVIDDVLALANADLFKVNLSLDGAADGVTLNAIKDLKADLTAYVDLNGISVGADAAVSYKVSEDKYISAKLSVWYDRGAEGFGSAVVSLKEINGVETSMNVCCDIDELVTAVNALLKRANIELSALSTEKSEETSDLLGGVISDLLNADFGKLLPELNTNASGLKLSVSVDEVLSLFGADLGMSFGNLQLKYLHGAESYLYADLPALGLSLDLGGAEGSIEIPDGKNCLDLADLVDTVNAVWEQIDGIIDNKSVSFNINKNNTFLAMDGIVIGFGGNGEICWAKGREMVALDLVMSITEIEEGGARLPDEATVKVLYDKNADDDEPFIRLAINGVGLDIYRSDIEGVKNTFGAIYNNVEGLLGTDEQPAEDKDTDNTTVEEVTFDSSKVTSNDTLMGVIFKLLASDGWVKFLNDFTLTSDGKSVALSYLTDNAASVKISADNNARLYYDGSFGSKDDRMSEIFGGNRFAFAGEVTVTSVVGTICDGLNEFFDEVNKSTAKNEQTAFLRLAYDFLFEGISCFSVENILGSDTYAVNFNLDGNNCNIDALKDVFIDAQIYVTGAKGEHGKLAEGFLNIDAAGIIIKLNVITERSASGTNFYVELNQIMDVVLNLKFLATQDSLYKTLEALVNAVNKTDVIEFVTGMLGSSEGETKVPDDSKTNIDGAVGGEVLEEEKVSNIASLIQNIVNFNFSDAFIATAGEGKFEVDGVLDATIDLDNIITQLGIAQDGFGQLGSARVVINHVDHSMTTYGTTTVTDDNGEATVKEWISLTSKLTEARDYTSLDKADYISVEFLPDLLNDVVKFATDDDGKIYDSFTLSGSITASINLVVTTINANIDISTLTVSFGENGLSLSGVLHINKISALSVVTIPDSTVGISISNGYVTLAKGLTSTPEYKIMTMEYFLDHMLVKNGSVLEWWLDVSGWSTLISIINKSAGDLSISSGLTTPEEIYLYKNVVDKTTTEVSMYDYVDSLRVIIDGVQTACFGDYTVFERQLGINDNYYGFALNGGKISGGVLNKLYAAITRNDTVGISGVKAYASIDAGSLKEMVKLNVNLSYEEGLTADNDFVIGNTLANSGMRAPDFYKLATEEVGGADEIDFAHNVKKPESGYDEIFGSFTTADGSYDYSHMLYTHELTIVNLDGTKEVRSVRNGSTVYFYDNYSPAYTDNTKAFRLLYSTDANALSGTSVKINGDTVVYAISRESVKVVVHSGNAEYEITSFIGDAVPVEVKGLEAIEAPYYEDGTLVGADDKITEVQTLHIYGTFVQSVVTVNYVNYQFSFDQSTKTGSYTAVGRAAGFNSYYCTDGNTLVIESEIEGYPVTAIAAEAFANTEGYSIKNVVVPATVTTVGEKAFLDNVGMQSAVFLADTVTFGGSSNEGESGNTTPFYGCSAEAGGKTTNLIVYYNTIVFEGSTSNKYWTKFKRDGSGAIYNRYYIGVDPDGYKFVDYNHAGGGAIYAAGTWQFVDAQFELDLSGVASTKLNSESVQSFLASYYPFVATTEFIGSAKATEIEQAMEVYLAQFDFVSGGITYKCTVTANYEKNGNVTAASYFISFTQAAKITVLSNYDCIYYGVNVSANTPTEITIPVESLENLATPTDSLRVFVGMEKEEQADGSILVKLEWREKNTYKFTYTISGSGTRYNDTLAGKNNEYATKVSNSFDVVEGQQLVFERSADGHVLTIYVDGEVKTVVTLVKFTFGYYSFKTQGTNDFTSITVGANESRTFKY